MNEVTFAIMSWNWLSANYYEVPVWIWILAVLALVMWFIQLFYWVAYYFPLVSKRSEERAIKQLGVSVIVCARNEEKNLMMNIPKIMEQDYPNFELIVVNDSSYDDTADILKALSINYPNMHVIHIDEDKQNMQGKKFALTLGIKAAKHDIVLLTDADCYPRTNQWISEIASAYKNDSKVVLGYSPFVKYKGWFNKLVRLDNTMVAMTYLGLAKSGKPYMGVGRNLSYYTELFFKVGGFKSNYSILSGDDDLLINQIATKQNCTVAFSKDAQTISEPKRNFKEWKIQKRRHFTTSPMYKSSDKRRLMLLPVSWFLMNALSVIIVILQPLMYPIFILIVLRWIWITSGTYRFLKHSQQPVDIAFLAPIIELQMQVLHVWFYFSNLIRKPQKWN
jgi:cellulose synthase/poly-beta-1,6-N-acetylglucosamine synthase-like glycosyltransferase